MQNYLQEISNICNLPFDEVIKDFKVVWLGGRGVYLSNFKKLLNYSDRHIILKLHNDILNIWGENIQINQINQHEIVINGRINTICIGDGYENK